MQRFLKASAVDGKSGKGLLSVDISSTQNQLSDSDIEIGAPTKMIALPKLKPDQQKKAIMGMRKFLQVAAKYIFDHFPLHREILKDLVCLHPLLQKATQGVKAIKRIAEKLPQVICEEDLCLLTDEWKLYQAQDIPEEWYIIPGTKDESPTYVHVDHYWRRVFDQKNAMGIPHYTVLRSW